MADGWRPMQVADLPVVKAISDAVHGGYTEDAAVYAERLALYPAGCLMFERGGESLGYMVSHPWVRGTPPALNCLIGAIPAAGDVYYIHDLALLPRARGGGVGAAAMPLVTEQAQACGMETLMLTAVGGADSFWARQGFAVLASDAYGPGTVLMERRCRT